jgi:hypothetical protein
MTRHTYPVSALFGDYLRAAAGLIPAFAVLAIAPVGIFETTLLGGLALLFSAFGIRTALRQFTAIEVTAAALRASGALRVNISWDELDRMRLAYYSTRRDGRNGWMQLELRSGSSTLRVDSRIIGFSELVTASAKAAAMRSLPLDPVTSVNLQALGIERRAAVAPLAEFAAGGAE